MPPALPRLRSRRCEAPCDVSCSTLAGSTPIRALLRIADRVLSRGNHPHPRTGYDHIGPVTCPAYQDISIAGRSGNDNEATMTTRKPKPTFESMIELPTLQLATVS